MKQISVYKSEEGKKKIIDHYDMILKTHGAKFSGEYVDTEFGKTHILTAGKKNAEPIILIHGSCSNSTMWLGDMGVLSKNYRVIAVDIPGEPGKSAETRLSTENDDFAFWIKEVMKGLDIKKASIAGNSFGGWAALKFASRFPEMVSNLILIASSGILPPKMSFVIKSILYTMKGEKGIEPLNRMIFGNNNIPKEVIETSSLILKNFNPRVGSLPSFDEEQLEKLTMPVLYLGGEKDVTVDTKKSAEKMTRYVENAVSDIIMGCGHVIYNTATRINEFLAGEVG